MLKLLLTDTWDLKRPNLTGFMYFWAKHVRGFDQKNHCGNCLEGPYSPLVTKTMLLENMTDMLRGAPKEFDYLYICGVAAPYKWANNFHLALRPTHDLRIVEADTYNGFKINVQGAEALEIPALPNGFQGLSKAFTTCRNFQFGVHYYGWQEK